MSLYHIISTHNNSFLSLKPLSGVGDGDLNLYAGLNVDGGDLLHDLGGAVEVNHSLVDPHLELVPGLGSLSARSLPGGHPHRALHLQLLVLGAADEVTAPC